MTVKELIKALKKLDKDAEVEIADSYWRSEGYSGEDIENASAGIAGIRFHNGHYIIEDDDCYL